MSAEFHDVQGDDNVVEHDIYGQLSNDRIYLSIIEEQDHEISWYIEDVPATQVPNLSY